MPEPCVRLFPLYILWSLFARPLKNFVEGRKKLQNGFNILKKNYKRSQNIPQKP